MTPSGLDQALEETKAAITTPSVVEIEEEAMVVARETTTEEVTSSLTVAECKEAVVMEGLKCNKGLPVEETATKGLFSWETSALT
jgi:hypothetical protein